MAIIIEGERYLRVKEAAKMSDRAINTIYQKHKAWGWKSIPYGRNIMFKETEIQHWMKQQIKAA